jgi:hypothetical protein
MVKVVLDYNQAKFLKKNKINDLNFFYFKDISFYKYRKTLNYIFSKNVFSEI